MRANIVFLGTGGDAHVVGQQLRSCGGLLITSGDTQIHVDPGPGSLIMAKACNQNLRLNTGILVTHNHLKHCNDVNQVIEAMTHAGLDKNGVLISNKTLVEGTEDLAPYLTDFHRSCLERSIILEPSRKAGINEIDIQAIAARHSDPNALSYKLIAPNFSVCITGDTGLDEDLARFYNADVLILNVQHPGENHHDGHLCTEEAAQIVKAAKPKLAIITHFGTKMLNTDPGFEAKVIQQRSRIKTIAAADGLMVNPISFSTGKPII
ncbi:MAG: MBL fold metallo-hydrolase [Nanoarchaeota archaeon]|nr:MBL fold metallo-hydrolase [Nanoarchaeota archaeon]